MVRARRDPHKAEGLVTWFYRNALYRFALRHCKRDSRMAGFMPGKALAIPLCWRVHGERENGQPGLTKEAALQGGRRVENGGGDFVMEGKGFVLVEPAKLPARVDLEELRLALLPDNEVEATEL